MKIFKLTIAILLFSLTFASVSCAANQRELVLNDGSRLTINRVFHREGAELPPRDSVSIANIQRIWDRLSAVSGFDAFVMYDPSEEVNAYIAQIDRNSFLVVLQLGLLRIIRTEDEVAGVLGHEIGHGVRRHMERQAGRTIGVRIGANILGSLLGGGLLTDLAVGVGANLAVSGYSREHEVEADDLGVEFSARAGFNPMGLHNAIESMANAGLVTPPSGFNSHPPTERRMTRLRNEAQRWERYLAANRSAANSQPAANNELVAHNAPAVAGNVNVQQVGQLVPEGNPAVNNSDGLDVIDSYPISSGEKNILRILHNRGITLYNSGRHRDALSIFSDGVSTYEGNFLAALWAARSAQRLGNRDEMRNWIDKSLAINPNYVPARQLRDRYF